MGARVAVVVLAVLTITGWGAAVGLGAAVLALQRDAGPAAVVATGLPGTVPETVPEVVAAEPPPPAEPLPPEVPVPEAPVEAAYELTVHSDGCGVIRSEGPDGRDLDSLTWSVVDADGFEVLGRNALGETRYRYFAPGTYDVVLEAYGAESYVPVSNTVTISC